MSAFYRNYSRRARLLARGLDLLAAPAAPILRLAAPRGAPADPPRSILVVRLDHLGDVLMTTPAIGALRRAFPTARIDVLAAPWGRAALEANPDVDEILEGTAPWYDPRKGELPALVDLLRPAARLRSRAYDWAFDMRGDPRVILFYLLPAARRRFGFSGLGLERLLTDARPCDRRRTPLDLALDLAAAAGARGGSRRPVFAIDEAARRVAAERLHEHGIDPGGRFAVVAPGANRPVARWGADRFAAVADRLVDAGCAVVVTGREEDRPVTGEVVALAGRPVADATGLFDLRHLAAVLERAAVCLANDSGAVHLAAAAGCPVVAVFGPTDPALTFPYEDGRSYISRAAPIDHPRPCFNVDCESDHGFPAIAPEDVAAACLRAAR